MKRQFDARCSLLPGILRNRALHRRKESPSFRAFQSCVLTGPSPQVRRERARNNWWIVVLRGICGVLFGFLAIAWPGPTMLSLMLFLAAYLLVDGGFAIVAAVRAARKGEQWGLLLLQGILGVIAGVIAFLMPGPTLLAVILLIAAWSIVSGCLMVAAAFRLDRAYGRWWLVLAAASLTVFGVMLVIAPLVGAVVLTCCSVPLHWFSAACSLRWVTSCARGGATRRRPLSRSRQLD